MKKLFYLIITLLITNISYSQSLKVANGQTIIPLNSSYWITSNLPPSDQYVRLRLHSRAESFNAAFIDYWRNLYFRSGNPGANTTMHITNDGFVGINGVAVPSRTSTNKVGNLFASSGSNFRLQVFGNSLANGYWQFSDSSIKENVIGISNVMPQLMKLSPIEYNYKIVKLSGDSPNDTNTIDSTNLYATTDSKKHYGFTAQQVKRLFPVLETEFNDDLGVVDYVGFVPLLVAGAQEHQRTIDTLKRTIDSLNLQIQNLRQEMVNWKGQTLDTPSDKSRLFQNNPNPFDGTTSISYFIDENTSVTSASIEIRNIMGNLITSIALADQSGIGDVTFNGANLNQGYYIYTLKINGGVKDSKMFLKE